MTQYQQRETELVYYPQRLARTDTYARRLDKAFAAALHAQGWRLTAERQAILDVLVEAKHHLSIEELFDHATRKHPRLGRATMFRTLKVLREAGLVSRIAVPNNGYRYEAHYERPHHDHLICVACGRIVEVQWPEVEKVQEQTCRVYRFTPLWHRHEIFGRCQSCGKGAR
ncbi:MAG: transcriptional repressor [Elusimicrobia bacterium]|nr:transcriptional repressor [Elusimicrobiota bacterium]